MEKTNFDRLLKQYLRGQLSEPEKIKLEAWMDVMKTEKNTDLEMSKEDEEKLFQKISGNLDNIEEVVAFRPHQGKLRSLFANRWLRVAASFLLLVVASYTIWYVVITNSKIKQTIAVNDIEKLILNDGTIVWLHKGSKLIYYQKTEAGIRHAELVGEALFEVAKDPNNPFAIECGDITVRVLGTSFSLKTDKESIELKVLTGKVNLSSAVDKIGVDVVTNEKAIYTRYGEIEKISLSSDDIATITASTEYDMKFQNTSMDKVFEKIQKKFDVQLTIESKQLTKCRVTGDFTDRSLDGTFQMLSELMELEYKISGTTVAISGKGCD